MGTFSWLTCDTQESIRISRAGKSQPVYLLRPHGQPPIKEADYEGYGVFGGQDAYVLLAQMNFPNTQFSDIDYQRTVGLGLALGSYYQDTDTGALWAIFHPYAEILPELNVSQFPGHFLDIIPEYGETPNTLIKNGRLRPVPIQSFLSSYLPLKFSFNPEARYEDFPGSLDCPHQGVFYPSPSHTEDHRMSLATIKPFLDWIALADTLVVDDLPAKDFTLFPATDASQPTDPAVLFHLVDDEGIAHTVTVTYSQLLNATIEPHGTLVTPVNDLNFPTVITAYQHIPLPPPT